MATREELLSLAEDIRSTEWHDLVAPIVARCEVAAAFDKSACWDAEGSRALGKLLKVMAEKLDEAYNLLVSNSEDPR